MQEAGNTLPYTFPRPRKSVVIQLCKNCATSRVFQQRPDLLQIRQLAGLMHRGSSRERFTSNGAKRTMCKSEGMAKEERGA